MNRKHLVAIGIVTAAIVLVVYLAQVRVVVANHSGQSVDRVSVDAAGVKVELGAIKNGGRRSFRFFAQREGGVAVRATLADGTPVGGQGGYVTKGLYFWSFKFTIMPDGSLLRDGQRTDALEPSDTIDQHVASTKPSASATGDARYKEAVAKAHSVSKGLADLAAEPGIDYPKFESPTTFPSPSRLPTTEKLPTGHQRHPAR